VQASEWVLIDLRVDQIVDGFAHCRAGLWAQDGTTLLATVAQTATLRRAERA
jgi:acyl-CoA thioesterase